MTRVDHCPCLVAWDDSGYWHVSVWYLEKEKTWLTVWTAPDRWVIDGPPRQAQAHEFSDQFELIDFIEQHFAGWNIAHSDFEVEGWDAGETIPAGG